MDREAPTRTPDSLDDRKAKILRAIVEEYVTTAQPVASKTVVARQGLNVSAATVRNDMGLLERDGYIAQPHTSAGRVPTDRGYRYFVDHAVPPSSLPDPQRREVAEFFGSTSRVIDDLLHETSHLLARLTRHAAVVVGPQHEIVRVRAVHLVVLEPRVVLAIAVLGNGAVEKETLRFEHDVDAADVEAASRRLSEHCEGHEFAAIEAPERGAAPSGADAIFDAACAALVERGLSTPEPIFVGGASRLAAEGEAFSSPAAVSRVLELLEQQTVVVALMRELLGPGLTISIGSENPSPDLQDCSLVLAPYLVEGTQAGTIGVLGPTRMDYRQAQAAVATISAQLSRELSR